MSKYQILHNPRCSKSRETLALLAQHDIDADVVEYLKQPPSAAQIEAICDKLGVSPETIVRKKEAEFKALGLHEQNLTAKQWCQVLADNPKLIERPIVIKGDNARIGRPPEAVLELIND
ncbi:arsenate reductase (glutaredoxin) [Aliidiomarina maris]|uniref:Arsenate reductase n=1 Tax=Aliidiomarina maris TaxID=531312 RepID=A0A327X1Z3_9GAMM|nr:arsenate reductase (glutaredoxin) [Aliidiomarina maris]RAJ96463.1 arsenate reductase [Aliidiomarina maris]RUO23784.1 arsenate reductase (glutaredoxin) [Aliidiomarina maris]